MKAQIKAITAWSFLAGACIFGGILVFSSESAHTQPFPPVELVSTGSNGQAANEGNAGPVPSAQCECVAFISRATNLANVGPNPIDNVFVKFESGELVLVSAAEDGGPANGPSQAQGFRPSVGGPCSCVGFSSDATNLVPDDTNNTTDVFVRDMDVAVTVRASVNDAGEQANGPSSFTSLNSACSAVAFQSTADNLVLDDTNGASDIFIRNLATSTTIRITEGPDGEANGSSITAGISSDGNCVAFATQATNLFPGEDNSPNRILVWCNGQIVCRADVSTDGEPSNDMSFLPQLSSDGRYVAFKSEATNLIENDGNHQPDVFRHDCQTGETILISVNSRGEQSDDINSPPSISGDGRFVCFVSWGSNMGAPLATGGFPQVYCRDVNLETTDPISTNVFGGLGRGSIPDEPPSVSLDSRWVTWASTARDLVPVDPNSVQDAFIRENLRFDTPTPTNTPTITNTPTVTPTPPIPCNQDIDCPAGFVCENDICVPAPTPTPPIECVNDSDCPEGQTCVEDVCRPPPTPTPTPLPPCETDADCEPFPGTKCRAMVCVPIRMCMDQDQCRGVRETCLGEMCECGGDCNLNGLVQGTEITTQVLILGGERPIDDCLAGDINMDGEITGCDITLSCVNLGLGCPGEGTPLTFGLSIAEQRIIDLGMNSAIPGEFFELEFSVLGGDGVSTAQVDIVYPTDILDVPATFPEPICVIDPRLADDFELVVFEPQVPRNDVGFARLRVGVIEGCKEPPLLPIDTFGAGPIMTCMFRIQPGAPVGQLVLSDMAEREEIGDNTGNAFPSAVENGVIDVLPPPICENDEMCPVGTHCRAGICQGIRDCSGPTAGPTECLDRRETCLNMVCECVGDCSLDGEVFPDEIIDMINIFGGVEPVDTCPAADFEGDGEVFPSEVIIGITNFGDGCPRPGQ